MITNFLRYQGKIYSLYITCFINSLLFRYMLGRFTIETLNEFVTAFNITLQEKYRFINSYSNHASNESDFKRFKLYKSQELPETRGNQKLF